MRVPCGQCIGCRTARRKKWAARIMHEASQYKTNSFLTLTYRDKNECTENQRKNDWHIPDENTLVKSHHQKFIKRLRNAFPSTRLKYYHCGEYGDDNDRPHYHTALFNLGFDDEKLYSKNDGYPLFTSQTLEELWRYGFATVGNLDHEAASYIAGYILKKITGPRAHDHYLRMDEYGRDYWLQPEYATMSTGQKKGDGIGATWFKKYHTDCFPSDSIVIPSVGVVRGVPRYYETLMEDINPTALENAKAIRKQFAKSHPENYTQQALESQQKIYRANQQRHRRNQI